jgi:hypothetical protein
MRKIDLFFGLIGVLLISFHFNLGWDGTLGLTLLLIYIDERFGENSN